MANFIFYGILWTLALYGLLEIIKTIIYICTYTNLKSDGTYLIVAVKNQENKIEFFIITISFFVWKRRLFKKYYYSRFKFYR